MMVTVLLTLTYISTGEWLAFWVFFVATVIMAGVVYFLIKRAINQRDEAFEW